jgi:hypothetical protein
MANFVFGMNFVRQYVLYSLMLDKYSQSLVKTECEVPASWFIAIYVSLF